MPCVGTMVNILNLANLGELRYYIEVRKGGKVFRWRPGDNR